MVVAPGSLFALPGRPLRGLLLYLRKTRCRATVHAGLYRVCEGQVHVVAAQHQVVAYTDAFQVDFAVGAVVDADQAQVGGAPTYVAYQCQAAATQRLRQIVVVAGQPVVERGLRFF